MTELPHDLNPPQRDAVEHKTGPLLILAGAGSGKTRVITHRLARLVDSGVRPWRILAVTFTNKAAGEMRERARRLLGDAAQKIWIGTFHATCAKLLRIHADAAGLRPDFLIFDDGDQKTLVTRVMRDLGISERVATPRAVLSGIDRAKNAGIPADEYRGEDFMTDIVATVYPEYQKRLRASGGVDFGDLLLEMLRLIKHDREVSAELEQRFDHVLVDEFQDTNRVQYQLVRHLSRATGNLCVVGDDDQSIYRWRGADLRNILDFEADHPGCKTVKLEQNYRSTQIILDAANAVIAKNRDRKQKRLFTENAGGEPILYFTAPDERSEARFVVQAIRTLEMHEERALGDFAVFYRTHAQSRAVEEALRAAGIPYTVVGGTRFYDRAEIKDVLAYLRVIANPADEVSLERIVNVPARGIGDATLDRVRELRRARGLTLWQAMIVAAANEGGVEVLGPGPRKKLGGFVQLVEELRGMAGLRQNGKAEEPPPKRRRREKSDETANQGDLFATEQPPDQAPAPPSAKAEDASVTLDLAELTEHVLEKTGYLERLQSEGTEEARDRQENLAELISSLHDYQRDVETPSLVDYLERVSLQSPADGSPSGVAMMTIHAAKGLEFPVVFVTGLEEGTFPRVERGAPREEMEEERRLAYVAMTRARERLVLTNAARRIRYGESGGSLSFTPVLDEADPMALHESRFIGDIPTACIARPVTPERQRREVRMELRPPPTNIEDRGDGVVVVREPDAESSSLRRAPAGSFAASRAPSPGDVYIDYDGDDGSAGGLRPGQSVHHAQFGDGKVLAVSGSGGQAKATVHFASSGVTKTVMARYLQGA